MFVADYIETSLLDWDGKISCVLFSSGCNFRCPWCQNKDLALCEIKNEIPIEDILQKCRSKKNWIDGFVISGGEPTINKDLKKIISEIKKNGFLVKIDTNGSNPGIIKELISSNIIDAVSMDIKTALKKDKYDKASGINADLKAVNETIDILLNSDIECYFRTTAVPGIADINDIKEIAGRIKGRKYIVQKFIPHNTINSEYRKIVPYTEQEMKDMEEASYEKVF